MLMEHCANHTIIPIKTTSFNKFTTIVQFINEYHLIFHFQMISNFPVHNEINDQRVIGPSGTILSHQLKHGP